MITRGFLDRLRRDDPVAVEQAIGAVLETVVMGHWVDKGLSHALRTRTGKIELIETRYTPDLAVDICRRVSEGEPLRQVCRDAGMPPESTVRLWVRDDRDNLAARYQAARAMQVECWADEIVLIANRERH
jgi:hypothetical protein